MSPVLFVIGAGASAEFGLPTGAELIRRITNRVDFRLSDEDPRSRLVSSEAIDLYRLVNDHPRPEAMHEAAARISNGLRFSASIDDFLYNHGQDPAVVELGKVAIAAVILEAERDADALIKLEDADTAGHELGRLSGTWLFKLFTLLTTGVRREELHRLFDGVSIINFSYDRVVEHFLKHAIIAAYSVNAEEAEAALSRLPNHHAYGMVGRFGAIGPAEGIRMRYGEQWRSQPQVLLDLSSQVLTFTESAHDPDEIEAMRALVNAARTIVFLGFGFHPQNVRLLGENSPDVHQPPHEVLATAYDTLESDRAVFASRLIWQRKGTLYDTSPQSFPCTAAELVTQQGQSLRRKLGR